MGVHGGGKFLKVKLPKSVLVTLSLPRQLHLPVDEHGRYLDQNVALITAHLNPEQSKWECIAVGNFSNKNPQKYAHMTLSPMSAPRSRQ